MIRLLWRSAALMALLLAGLLILFSVYRLLPPPKRGWIRQRWSQVLLHVCGVRLCVSGQWPDDRCASSCLVVMNHVSWLDIFALNAVMPVTFVAKSEIRRWPLVGWLVSGTGTIFIERGRRHAVRQVNHVIRRRVSHNEHVAFFPEGTTSDGSDVLRFHTSLFAAALHDEDAVSLVTPIFPVGIRYFDAGRRSAVPAYVGDDTLVGSIVRILQHRSLSVELTGLSQILAVPPATTRHELAGRVEQQVRALVEA
jgi:1-acyl-sn-glycerol-3-phosphate acyltransferase